jgi:hypothetical protein
VFCVVFAFGVGFLVQGVVLLLNSVDKFCSGSVSSGFTAVVERGQYGR